jgi:hypothetical protein
MRSKTGHGAVIFGTLMALAITTASATSSQYLCITKSVGGLRYDAATQSWRTQAFTPNGKYILRRITGDDVKKWDALLKKFEIRDGQPREEQMFGVGDWAFLSFGENPRLIGLCLEGPENDGVRLPFFCQPAAWVPFSDFSTDSRRFELVSHGGYIEQRYQEQLRRDAEKLKREPSGLVSDPSHPHNLSIEIGECSPF